jgi:hypothetical protein
LLYDDTLWQERVDYYLKIMSLDDLVANSLRQSFSKALMEKSKDHSELIKVIKKSNFMSSLEKDILIKGINETPLSDECKLHALLEQAILKNKKHFWENDENACLEGPRYKFESVLTSLSGEVGEPEPYGLLRSASFNYELKNQDEVNNFDYTSILRGEKMCFERRHDGWYAHALSLEKQLCVLKLQDKYTRQLDGIHLENSKLAFSSSSKGVAQGSFRNYLFEKIVKENAVFVNDRFRIQFDQKKVKKYQTWVAMINTFLKFNKYEAESKTKLLCPMTILQREVHKRNGQGQQVQIQEEKASSDLEILMRFNSSKEAAFAKHVIAEINENFDFNVFFNMFLYQFIFRPLSPEETKHAQTGFCVLFEKRKKTWFMHFWNPKEKEASISEVEVKILEDQQQLEAIAQQKSSVTPYCQEAGTLDQIATKCNPHSLFRQKCLYLSNSRAIQAGHYSAWQAF